MEGNLPTKFPSSLELFINVFFFHFEEYIELLASVFGECKFNFSIQNTQSHAAWMVSPNSGSSKELRCNPLSFLAWAYVQLCYI